MSAPTGAGFGGNPGFDASPGFGSSPGFGGNPEFGAEPELDLDRLPAPVRQRRARRRAPALPLVLALAAVTGAWAHAAVETAGPVAAPPRVSARVTLDDVRLVDGPQVTLRLLVASHDDATVVLVGLQVDGAGVAAQSQSLWRPLTPGLVEELHLDAHADCRAGVRASPLRVALTLTRAPSPTGTTGTGTPDPQAPSPGAGAVQVVAEPAGPVQVPGGLCRAIDQRLPAGFPATARAGTAPPTAVPTLDPTTGALTLQVSGLPSGTGDFFAAQADGWLIPLLSPARPTAAGRVSVVLGPPQPQCTDLGTRRVLPTGVQLLDSDGSGVHQVYVEVGPELARWLLTARRAACPDAAGVS